MARIRARRKDLVLDVGSGHFPHGTADVLMDRYLEDVQGHRSGKRLVRDRPVVLGDIQCMPFKNKSFDYVICNHVLEHVPDPGIALQELSRVGKKGYLATPSELHEFLCPTVAHRWVFALESGRLLIRPKMERHALGLQMYGGLFHKLYDQVDFRRLVFRRPDLFFVALEWQDEIPFEIDQEDQPFYNYHDPHLLAERIRPTLADGWIDWAKRWIRIRNDLSKTMSLTQWRGRVRRALKRGGR